MLYDYTIVSKTMALIHRHIFSLILVIWKKNNNNVKMTHPAIEHKTEGYVS